MEPKLTRREFLSATSAAAVLTALGGSLGKAAQAAVRLGAHAQASRKLVVASATDIRAAIGRAFKELGGIEKFVRKGDKVVLKPNAAWARRPGQGATTNPEVVEAVAELCKKAGAGRVTVLEHLIDRPAAVVLSMTGISAAAEKAGARVVSAGDELMYREVKLPKGKVLRKEMVASGILDADVFINMPVAKVHSQTDLSLGMKNLMGIIWDRQAWHTSVDLDQCIADFAAAVRPSVTILDATTMLLTNGPKGPGKTRKENKLVVGTDPVSVDAFGATLFGIVPADIQHIALAHKSGVGEIRLDAVKVVKV